MRNPGGAFIIMDPDARQVEQHQDTFTCGHCNRVTFVKPRERPEDTGGFCRQCTKLICSGCAGVGSCLPLEENLRRMEAREDALRSYGL